MKRLNFNMRTAALTLILTCLPMMTWADNTGLGTSETPYDLSQGDVTLTTAGTYYITGDGSANGYTILFNDNTDNATYTLYLDNVTIDTSNRADTICGLYINGNNISVKLDIADSCSITGSTYGIYVENGSSASLTIDAEDSECLTINADYGIYFCGDSFKTENTHMGDDIAAGQITINAKYCGIYLGSSVSENSIQSTSIDINISGSASDLTENNITDIAGVSGIYCAMSSTLTLAMINLTIYAPGEGTYGIYCNTSSGNTVYFGFGNYVITATKCVLHREGKYTGISYAENAADGLVVTFQLNGPFCYHLDSTWENGGVTYVSWWTCDGGEGTSTLEDIEDGTASKDNTGTSKLNSKAKYPVDDAVNDYDGVTATINNAYEVVYFDRYLYTGWNTISLPCEYDLEIAENVLDTDTLYEGTEARYLITRYATYNEMQSDGEGNYVVNLNIEADTTLSANTAYLVYVEDKGAMNGTLAKFTSMSKNYSAVNDDKGNVLRTVYHAETIKSDGTISGDSIATETHHYKLDRIVVDEDSVYNYFNKATTEATVGAFRAYLSLDDVMNSDEAGDVKSVSLQFSNGETTSIQELNGGTNNENRRVNVYGIDGKLIKTAGKDGATKGLSRGIYVVDGKKVVVM